MGGHQSESASGDRMNGLTGNSTLATGFDHSATLCLRILFRYFILKYKEGIKRLHYMIFVVKIFKKHIRFRYKLLIV